MSSALSESALTFVRDCQIAVGAGADADRVQLLSVIWNCLQHVPEVKTQADRIAVSSAVLRIAWHIRQLPQADVREPRDKNPHRLSRRARVTTVLTLLARSHTRERLSLETSADAIGVTASHLCRALHAETGWGFLVHLEGMRMLDGVVLLRTTTLPVKSIAADVGFSSTSQFDHMFQKWFHMSPREFRGAVTLAPRVDNMCEQVAALWSADGYNRPAAIADAMGVDVGFVVHVMAGNTPA